MQSVVSHNVKNFSVEYNLANRSNVFSSGDYIAGRVAFEVTRHCKIDSLWVKMKGKAKVRWFEHYGKTVVVYKNKEKYFSIKTFIFQDGCGESVICNKSDTTNLLKIMCTFLHYRGHFFGILF